MKLAIQIILIAICSSIMLSASAEGIFDEEINPNPIVIAPDKQFVQIVQAIFKPGRGVFLNPCFDVYFGKDKSRNLIETCRRSFKESVSSAADNAGI